MARAAGCRVQILGNAIKGEAREVARRMAIQARAAQAEFSPGVPPLVLLSSGELIVTRRGGGVGGPDAESALALALALDGTPGVHVLACDTDGVDGADQIAGAMLDPGTLAREFGLDPQAALDDDDAHRFFAALGDKVVTGPTLTNVNDFRAILIEGASERS